MANGATGSVTRLPLAMPLACVSLATGLVLLVLAVRRMNRDW